LAKEAVARQERLGLAGGGFIALIVDRDGVARRGEVGTNAAADAAAAAGHQGRRLRVHASLVGGHWPGLGALSTITMEAIGRLFLVRCKWTVTGMPGVISACLAR